MLLKNKPTMSLRGSVAAAAIAGLLLIACGDETAETPLQSGQNYIEIVADESALPECSGDNEGEQVLVKGENVARTCVDGEWTAALAVGRDTVYLKDKDVSCYTVELIDKQGVKIICDGDSVGMLLNGSAGAQGDKGEDGAGCSLKQLDSVTARLVCGGDTMTVYLGLPPDTTKTVPTDEIDSEKIPVSLDSLVGYAQYGYFADNAEFRLYGLGDGHALRLTGVTFPGEITGSGRFYRFRDIELPSQYVMLEVQGKHIDLIGFGLRSKTIRLRALVDLSERTTANVNVLTELEFDRVKYLVTQEGMTVKQAKKQAQSEIFAQFYIDAKDFGESEYLNYFGESEAEAALFAVSFLLMTADEVSIPSNTFMQEFSPAIATKGEWNGDDANAKKARIADQLLDYDLVSVRRGVGDMTKDGTVGNFEKYIENFIEKVYAMEPCGEGSESELRVVNNENSLYHGQVFHCHGGFLTRESENKFANPEIDYGWLADLRDRHAYRTVKIGEQTWMAENLDFVNSRLISAYVGGERILYSESRYDGIGYTYFWYAAVDAQGVFSANNLDCDCERSCSSVYPVQGICPEGWHMPDTTEFRTLIDAVGGAQNAGRVLKSTSGWVDEEGYGENGIDSVGFSMLPTAGRLGYVWSANFSNESCGNDDMEYKAYYMGVDGQSGSAVFSEERMVYGRYVRCLKD